MRSMEFYRHSRSEDYRVKVHRLSFGMTEETPAPNYDQLVNCMMQSSSSEVRQERQTDNKGKSAKGRQSQSQPSSVGVKGPRPKGKNKVRKGKGNWEPRLMRPQYSSQGRP